MAEIIRWGIIGAGAVCEVKSGPGFYKAPGSQLLAVMRRDLDKARDFAARHQVAEFYDDTQALLHHPQIDALYIATPPAQHLHYALAAIKAGKHVYIEKPVTLNAAECAQLIAAAEQAKAKVCVAHYRRRLPCFVKMLEIINSGAIGKPLLAQIDLLRPQRQYTPDNWRIDPTQAGGGLFHDLAPHQLDLLHYWFGAVEAAGGQAFNQRQQHAADDCVLAWAKYKNGVLLQGRWHFAVAAKHYRDNFEIIGSEGSMRTDFFGDGSLYVKQGDLEQTIQAPHPAHFQQPLIEAVNDYFRGLEPNPSSLKDALASMRLMDQWTRSQT